MKKKKKEKNIIVRSFPGERLQKFIQTGKPIINGHYLCFCTPLDNDAVSITMPMSVPYVLYYDGKEWASWQSMTYGVVLGWIGPLPALSLDELMYYTPDEAPLTLFYIGNKEDATIFRFSTGPYYNYFNAFCQKGKKGQYIFQLNSRKTKATKWAKWNNKLKKWKRIKEYEKKEYPWKGKSERKGTFELELKKPKRKLKKKRKSMKLL